MIPQNTRAWESRIRVEAAVATGVALAAAEATATEVVPAGEAAEAVEAASPGKRAYGPFSGPSPPKNYSPVRILGHARSTHRVKGGPRPPSQRPSLP